MECRCGRKAVYYRRWEGRYYCSACLSRQVEKAFKKAIRENRLIGKSDRKIAVGISGGKDSAVLLTLIARHVKGKEIVPIIIDEGISGYRDRSMEVAKRLCDSLSLEPVVVRFRDYLKDLDELVRMGFREKPCSICGIGRRYLLNIVAKEIKADKLAIGHNLDDEASSILMNVLKNDPGRFWRMGFMAPPRPGFVTRIKPLRMIPEKEIVIYALANSIPYYDGECPYSRDNFRRHVLDMLNEMERKYPGTKIQVVKFYDRLARQKGLGGIPGDGDGEGKEDRGKEGMERPIMRCGICGEPSSSRICRFCEIRGRLGI